MTTLTSTYYKLTKAVDEYEKAVKLVVRHYFYCVTQVEIDIFKELLVLTQTDGEAICKELAFGEHSGASVYEHYHHLTVLELYTEIDDLITCILQAYTEVHLNPR